MRRPSFQFYPADWSSNPNLKRCTFAEKGIWVEVMCLLHDQEEYGVLRWTMQEIADAVKCRVVDLKSLHRKGVIKGDDKSLAEPFVYVPRSGRKDGPEVTLVPTQEGPIWFSSRMVRDEYVRVLRADGGGASDAQKTAPKDTKKATPKDAPKGGLGVAFGPRVSSSASTASTDSEDKSSALGDPGTMAWNLAKVLLMERGGMTEGRARTFFGGLLKRTGVEARDMFAACASCQSTSTQDPQSYLTRAAEGIANRKAEAKTPKRVSFV